MIEENEGYENSKHKLRSAWREIEAALNEGCAGGVCSIGGSKGGGGSGSNFSRSGDGTKVTSINGMTREQQWSLDGKENIEPEEPDTQYVDKDAKPFTGEEKYDEYWTQRKLTKTAKVDKIEENEVRTDDLTNMSNDLSHRYANMTAVQDDLKSLNDVKKHFDSTGKEYDIMVRVGETTKSVAEWEAELKRTDGENLPPEVPDLPPTEGGFSPEDVETDQLGSQIPFPELGEPPVN